MYQHDPKHVDVHVKDLALEHGNSVQTPATPDVTEKEEPEPLSQDQHHGHRSQVARCLFLSQDRANMTFHCERAVSKDVESKSTEPCQAKKACQVFIREKQWGQVFEYGKLAEELTVFPGSDWTGCKETRQSSSAGVLMLGTHTLKAYTRKQKVIAKSSAEAELNAAALGASEAKGVQSMMF